MNRFVCERCGYETNHKNNFRKHIYRKYECKPTQKNISMAIIRAKYNLSKDPQDDDEEEEEGILYCKHCFQSFTRKNNLKYHLLNTCKLRRSNHKKEMLGNLIRYGYITEEDFTEKEVNRLLKKGISNLMTKEKSNADEVLDCQINQCLKDKFIDEVTEYTI